MNPPDLLQYVLPLLQALLAQIGHLLDGHNLPGEQAPGIIDGPETAMADLPQILEDLLRVVLEEEIGYLGVPQAARPGDGRHRLY